MSETKGIIFENIDTGETYLISRETEGKFYRAKLAALMNSSNMSPNSDRGQDFGIRLKPEIQALLELWESDGDMIEKVAAFAKVPTDGMTHADFLSYYLHQQELGKDPEKQQNVQRRENQLSYEEKVAQLKAKARPEAMPEFDVTKVPDLSLEAFLGEDLPVEYRENTVVPGVVDETPVEESPEIESPPVLETPEKAPVKRSTKRPHQK
jgi:hypothetical protein